MGAVPTADGLTGISQGSTTHLKDAMKFGCFVLNANKKSPPCQCSPQVRLGLYREANNREWALAQVHGEPGPDSQPTITPRPNN